MVASYGHDKSLKVWDFNRSDGYKCMLTLSGHENEIYSIAAGPAENQVISGSFDNTVKVWDLTRPDGTQCVTTLDAPGKGARQVATSAEKVFCGYDFTMRIWRVTDPDNPQHIGTLEKLGTGFFLSIVVRLNGQVVTSTEDNKVRVWSVMNSEHVKCLITLEPEHLLDSVYIAELADGRVVSICEGNMMNVWDLEETDDPKNKLVASFDSYSRLNKCGHFSAITALPNGRVAIMHDYGNEYRLSIWDLSKPRKHTQTTVEP